MKNLIEKLIPTKEEFNTIALNAMVVWGAGNIANVVANSVFHYNLNKNNLIGHAIIGTSMGTYAYQKAGGGIKGFLSATFAFATAFNLSWEGFEWAVNPYHSNAVSEFSSKDTISDISIIYATTALSYLKETLCDYKKYPHGKEKWVL